MDSIEKLEKIENQLYSHQLDFDFDNNLFKFDNPSPIFQSTIEAFLDSDDYDFKKAAIYILVVSKIYFPHTLFKIFKILSEIEDEIVQYNFFNYMLNNEKLFLNFLYSLTYNISDKYIDYFIKLLTIKDSIEYKTLSIFLLENFKLKNYQTEAIYNFLIKEETDLKKLSDFYIESNFIKNFINSLKSGKSLPIKYDEVEKKDSFLVKKLNRKNSLSYFFNEDEKMYQIWIHLHEKTLENFDQITGIDFNAIVNYSKNLTLIFQFQSADNNIPPLPLSLNLNNEYDRDFISFIIENRAITFIIVDSKFEIQRYFQFLFSGPVFYKLTHQSILSENFPDFEWKQIEEGCKLIEDGKFVTVDLSISFFRKIDQNFTFFYQLIKLIDSKKDIKKFFHHFNPIFYTERDFKLIDKTGLETIVKNYIVELDKRIPFLLLFINNANNGQIKYLSYLLPENFTDSDLRQTVIKRVIFIAQYLSVRSISYYDIVVKIGKNFNIDIDEKFMNKLSEGLENIEPNLFK